uniref:Cadherin N-terminal domain-containing protein n=1 Tax=Sinocyclocheilus grahami TaxID=75366 RepID=A0A672SQR2_SINGR
MFRRCPRNFPLVLDLFYLEPEHTETRNWIHGDFVYFLLSKMSERTMARQVLLFIWFLSLSSALGQVSYSIPEEMAKGSLVGSIAQDLGLDLKRLKSGKAPRIFTEDSREYIGLNVFFSKHNFIYSSAKFCLNAK